MRGWKIALLLVWLGAGAAAFASGPDPVAERMLQAQTASGGWPKHLAGQAIDYAKPFDDAASAALAQAGRADDATIDNDATTREIVHLAEAWRAHGDDRYRDAALRGVDYLLAAQYANGGWPQFHPDRSGYRGQVTFNDDAMTRVVGLLQDIAEGEGALAAWTPLRGDAAAGAVERAVALILDLQVRIDGTPTIWAAQYDETTLQPATARSYELPSLASAESVAIVRLLVRQTPSPRIVDAIESAAAWFEAHGLADTAFERIGRDGSRPRDVRLVAQPGTTTWARFYDLQRQQPLLVDRGGAVVASLADMSDERRTGYAWYGIWPQSLLEKDLPRWRQRHAVEGRRAENP
ncbi:pectate lyase [Luteimonas sp. XNQY3]|nr:pectate lyase [Luteimonas sp. XNQY3]